MALWLCRTGKYGEYETKFLEEQKIFCTWDQLDWNLAEPSSREAFKAKLLETYPDEKAGVINNWTGQLWAFSHGMKVADLVVMPSKIAPLIHVGSIQSDYVFTPENAVPFMHTRSVKWIKDVQRLAVDQDLLFSFGAAMTICQITRNDAESRIRAMLNEKGAQSSRNAMQKKSSEPEAAEPFLDIDIEGNARDAISEQIIRKFAGHDLAKLVAAILEAKGFKTYVSPPGPDKGVDILASQGSLGFDASRICVQVKSGSEPVDRMVHDQLIGAMSNHKADYGLLVSWGGFKSSVTHEIANHFFKVRLWTNREIVDEYLNHYEALPESIREKVPLKRIWMIDRNEE